MKNYKRLGDYIREVDVKNRNLEITNLIGLSIQKIFIPSISNTIGTDMSTYRIIKQSQFAYCPVTSRNGEKVTIALYDRKKSAIISQAYNILEIADNQKLLPEYLMMWFCRPEFDRYARFMSHGSVREMFGWEEMCNVELPIPSLETQRKIVAEYNAVQKRIDLNNQLIQKLEETAQAIYKQWFVDFEFPNEEGKPYKSSGGEMVESELGDIPKGWRVNALSDIGEIKAGGDKPKVFSEIKTNKCQIPIYSNGITNAGLYGYTNKHNYPKNSITISARGTIGFSVLRREDFDAIVRLLVLIPKYPDYSIYLWQTIKKIEFDDSGSVQNQLTIPQISGISILLPRKEVLKRYDSNLNLIYKSVELQIKETQKLTELQSLLLSKMATIEK